MLLEDASQAETDAADLFEDAVQAARRAARHVQHGEASDARKDYAQVTGESKRVGRGRPLIQDV